MKFTSVLASLLAVACAAQPEAENAPQDVGETIDLDISYSIAAYPTAQPQELLTVYNGDDHYLTYKVVNEDDRDITIIGVGGVLLDPMTGKAKVNLTSGEVGPHALSRGDNVTFTQHIPFNVLTDNYALTPQLFLVVGDEIKMLPLRPQLITVVDEPISLFNPKLLFLEFVLGLTLAGIGYVIWDLWGRAYFRGTPTVTKKQARSAAKQGAAAHTTGAQKYDESWLPDSYKKKSKKA